MNGQLLKVRTGLTLLSVFLFASVGFSQTSLDFFLKAARENNPANKENLAITEKSGIQENIIKAETQSPKIFASGNVNYSPLIPNKDDPKAAGYDVAITDGGLYQALLNVEQPVFNRTTFETLIRQAKTEGEKSTNRAKLTLHQLEKEVTDQYILSYQSLNQIAFVNLLREQVVQQKKVIEALAARGIYKKSDILLIDIEIMNQDAGLNNLQAIYKRNIYTLFDLCGISGNADIELAATDIEFKTEQNQSQFLEKFRLDSLQEIYNLQVTNLKYRPQFRFYGNTGLNAIELPGIYRKFGVGLGISMFIPIYDGRQKDYTQMQSDINLQIINNYRQNFLVQKTNRQQAILSDLNQLKQKIELIREQLKKYEMLLELYKSQLQIGELDIVNYTNTLKSYTSAQNNLTISETNKLLIINENNYYNW